MKKPINLKFNELQLLLIIAAIILVINANLALGASAFISAYFGKR